MFNASAGRLSAIAGPQLSSRRSRSIVVIKSSREINVRFSFSRLFTIHCACRHTSSTFSSTQGSVSLQFYCTKNIWNFALSLTAFPTLFPSRLAGGLAASEPGSKYSADSSILCSSSSHPLTSFLIFLLSRSVWEEDVTDGWRYQSSTRWASVMNNNMCHGHGHSGNFWCMIVWYLNNENMVHCIIIMLWILRYCVSLASH